MKRIHTKLLLVVFVVLLLTGCSQQSNQLSNNPNRDTITTLPVQPAIIQDATEEDKAQYLPYSKQILDSSANKRRVLFFYANWCPTCIPADKEFSEKLDRIPSDVVLIRVNYNDTETEQEEKDLAKKYGITYQHSFVEIDTAGNAVKKWNGGKLEQFLSELK